MANRELVRLTALYVSYVLQDFTSGSLCEAETVDFVICGAVYVEGGPGVTLYSQSEETFSNS